MPKEMIPILNKPLIHYGVDEAFSAGIRQIAVVTGRGKQAIEDYFDFSYEVEKEVQGTPREQLLLEIRNIIDNCTFSYTRQKKIVGLGNAILSGETLIGDEPFAVVLADDLCVDTSRGVLFQMLPIFERYQCCIVAIEPVPREQISRYGCVDGSYIGDKVMEVRNIIEKPDPMAAPSTLGVVGRYILTPDIFDILRQVRPGTAGEIQLTDALLEKAHQGKLIAFEFEGKRFDCGSVEGFVNATQYFYEMTILGKG